MRDEQELLMRRKHAMLNQLASVSALAVETAENLPDLPEVPETAFPANAEAGGAAAEIESDPTVGNATDEADGQAEQNRAEQDVADTEAEQAIEGESDNRDSVAADGDEPEFAKASNS
jgi:hypothetical protein